MQETISENIKPLPARFYVSCPICSVTIMQAKSVIDGIIKCERCHKRVWFEIKDGKVFAVPLKLKDKPSTEIY